MRALYQFPMSVFSRRTRLALAHKGLDAELYDCRADEKPLAEARKLSPQGTMPVLVDEGRVLGDSTAIAHYLDAAYPERPALFPKKANDAHRALTIVGLVDNAMNGLVDLGTRYYVLRGDAAWDGVLRERLGRAQGSIDTVAKLATSPTLAGDAWSVADIWAFSAALWIAAFPSRASSSPAVAQMLTLGFRLPESLVAWAKQHESRPEVRAIYG